ncbi:dUTP diphosphatase [Bacillus pseudomycoides]|uniref:Uncharacterized protein n=1 Tax=Bacillus pseudomycoides TaxID=64104 RepID=A0A2C4X2B0_9BACI|nr:dUTP diphosphatase [Bacillus pseudomycoides]PDY45007.1 hypothetical protein CON79_22745 [Bacillus pseudomycoides]PEA82165.1 hypothetical protein CON99_18700 [Bacillus pseudomycoides]PED06103.1 hypothetical protein COO19_22880 [Bacillus pseudomycoides]PED68847.1 hypothetical protein CON97_28825 [Bacillus pseudomycoides]PEI39959.1 hypothetical protein CN620_17320 [Bacillus pseudomycoides]
MKTVNKAVKEIRTYVKKLRCIPNDEWTDCMHFMASIGNKYGHSDEIIDCIGLHHIQDDFYTKTKNEYIYRVDLDEFELYVRLLSLISIGMKLGRTFEDMEKAYFHKKQVNYDRLAS